MTEDTLQLYEHCMDAYHRTSHMIPKGNLYEMRFEDLEADPLGEMHRVYQNLGFDGWENLEVAIQKKLPELTHYRKNSFDMDQELMRKVYNRWKTSFERYGYPSRLPEHKVVPVQVG